MHSNDPSFRQRMRSGETLVGTFLKTPTSHGAEIIGALGFDFVVIDQEHGAFDRSATDHAILAARASGAPALVRISGQESILSVLDCGASGVLAPHVASAARARDVVAACRYSGGKRGFATSTRAGGYSSVRMWRHIADSDANTAVIAQIEDPEALAEIEDVAAIDGLDALFVGRADLAAAFGDPSDDPPSLRDAEARICAAARKAGKPICFYVAEPEETPRLAKLGATIFVMSSDQGFLRQAAAKDLAELRQLIGTF